MKQVNMAEIPEFECEVREVRLVKREGKPTGAVAVTTLGESGNFQLYCRDELMQGWVPSVGEVVVVRLAISGTYEPQIDVKAIRPRARTADERAPAKAAA